VLRVDIKPIVYGEATRCAASPSMSVLTYLRIAIDIFTRVDQKQDETKEQRFRGKIAFSHLNLFCGYAVAIAHPAVMRINGL